MVGLHKVRRQNIVVCEGNSESIIGNLMYSIKHGGIYRCSRTYRGTFEYTYNYNQS